MGAMIGIFVAMKQKLEEKLEHLYEFNTTSSSNYDTAIQLAASIATGLAEVQSGKGFSPASGTFSIQGLNMEWTTSIQAITEERARQAATSIEEGEMCDKLPEKSTGEKIWDGIVDGTGQAVSDTIDGIKALGDWETWENMGNAALHPIDTLSTMYNALSDSFINDVINGDAESRAKWGSYALTQVGLGLIGDKGLSKVSTVARGAKFAKVTEITAPRLQPAFAGGLTSGIMTSMLPPTGNWGNYLSGYLMFARPSWRQSELDALKDYKGFREQVIFKDGEELKKKTKGSSIPDLYSEGVKHAVEVKNYDVSTPAKRTRLAYVIGKQVEARLKNLPEGTKQTVRVDIRGQEVSPDEIIELVQKIKTKTNDNVTIEIKD
ncbi:MULTISPECIES: WXG100 family type VII secretion target [unclassified Bacillus cereus group]|uniref:WXG100 family type VII secretion target n=1 Tax=unclassified Bacillus cereus group TaxID=2750818 RepID=UPI001F57F209|nr:MULTISPECIES: WXG100 family type VII secretion target [unclassified Bacillus cereus group]